LIITIYITLFFIVLRFTVTVFNFISNPKLTRVNKHYTDFVSILIPARNEAPNVLPLLQSIHAQDYKNYEVIIYDDDSSDDTYRLCLSFTSAHPGFSVIKGAKLPDGWLGKNYACFQLAKKAKGDYLLFLDADEIVSAGLINSAVHRMKLYKLGLLSLFCNQVMQTPGEKTTVPLINYLLLNLFPVRLVYLIKSAVFSAASGQFMLFDAEIYREATWHKQVKGKIGGDAAIMKLVKSSGYNGEVLLANGLISCRMFKGYREAVTGLSKNALAAFNYSVAGLLVYLVLLVGGPMIVIMTLNFNLIFFMSGLIILMRIMISLASGQNAIYNVLLHPLQMINLTLIALFSIQKHLTNTVVWKGRPV